VSLEIYFSYPVAVAVTEVQKGPINAFASKFVFTGAVGMFYMYEKGNIYKLL
jgi:NADH:ubiquinone oxidoreductase subunit 3 (subunit A)